jgi:ABC-type glycerol-3-phosphate transport system substrate-binding protein
MRRLLTVAMTAVVLLAGCSRSDLPPETWVVTVCQALTPWRGAITDINQRAATQMAQARTIEQTRRALVELVTDARDATETARAAVAAAGVPDVSGGESVARGFERALTTTRDAYAAAAEDLGALAATDDTAFYNGVVDVMARLTRQYEQAGAELSEIDSPELRAAFDRAPECQ